MARPREENRQFETTIFILWVLFKWDCLGIGKLCIQSYMFADTYLQIYSQN